MQTPHIFIFVDEAGFNLAKTRRRGRNVIRKRTTLDVLGQRGANLTMCTAISSDGFLLHKPLIGPYNTKHLISFLGDLYGRLCLYGRWGKGCSEAKSANVCYCMGQCGISPLLCSHRVVYSPSLDGVTFPPSLLSIPQPHRGIIFLMEVEGLWPPSTWLNVPPGRNECWITGHICRRLPGMDQACQKILS